MEMGRCWNANATLLLSFPQPFLNTHLQREEGKEEGEVLIRVQVFDNSDLSPLAEAAVEVYGNQSTLASSKAGKDGVVMVTFLYHPGTWVIVTATKQGFVTNSAPWHASRIPLYASVSLYLLPQRPATLILYDDVVQVLLGSPVLRLVTVETTGGRKLKCFGEMEEYQ
ncbi:unnamed protein product [Coregonus sp. 'balchen']|nr:unnamed protein product [Coregonus sp. 'balchen']